jgi:hypothetical protein
MERKPQISAVLVDAAEQRREARRPGSGAVRIAFADPVPLEIEGRLVDVSDHGFRMSHQCPELATGQVVEFRHVEGKGQARVVWNRISPERIESGFLVLSA